MRQGPIGCAQLDNIRNDIVSVVASVEASQADHLRVQGISLPSHHSLHVFLAMTQAEGGRGRLHHDWWMTIMTGRGMGKDDQHVPASGSKELYCNLPFQQPLLPYDCPIHTPNTIYMQVDISDMHAMYQNARYSKSHTGNHSLLPSLLCICARWPVVRPPCWECAS